MEEVATDIVVDPLFVGLTRPAVVLGIPYHAFVIEFMAAALVFLAAGNLFYLLIALPLHAVLYLVSANDPGAFGGYFLWLKTVAPCRNRQFWGAASFSPVSTRKWRK